MSLHKIKIAIFDLTGCEGCEFHLLSLNEFLLDFFQDFEIVNWRLVAEKEKADFDIAFVEGAVTTKNQIKLLKEIRETSKIVVVLGACAISGNIFKLTSEKRKKLALKIYNKNYQLKAKFLEPVEKFIKIDEKIPGCPFDVELFKKTLEKFKAKKQISKIKKVTPPDFIAKIEGHGTLKINFKEKKVLFEVAESERLIEGLLIGKDFLQAPFVNSRICGICPVAHNLCSWLAIENALSIKVSQETIILRKILLAAQIIKSHTLHLFFLVLPDYGKTKSAIDFSKKYPAEFHLMLNLKRATDKILEIVGGSPMFPSNTMLGGFKNPPEMEKLFLIKNFIFEVIDEAEDLIKIFSNLKIPELKTDTKFLTIAPGDNSYPLYPASLDFVKNELIKEIIKKNSPAKLGVLKNGEVVKTGAIARLNCFHSMLNLKAKRAFQKLDFDFQNPFNNNLAQAIEILHFLEEIINLIDEISIKNLKNAKGIDFLKTPCILKQKLVVGNACIEAPRGILFHQTKIDFQGKIIDYNIIPPTQINLACLEKETQELIKKQKKNSSPHSAKGFGETRQKQKKEIQELIRAFDPCITCAVH